MSPMNTKHQSRIITNNECRIPYAAPVFDTTRNIRVNKNRSYAFSPIDEARQIEYGCLYFDRTSPMTVPGGSTVKCHNT